MSSKQVLRIAELSASCVSVAILVAGCSSGSSSTAGAPSGSTQQHSSVAAPSGSDVGNDSAAPSSSMQSAITAAQDQINKYLDMPKFTPPGPAVDISKAKGKTVVVIPFQFSNPSLMASVAGIKAAGEAIGVTVEADNGQGNPGTVQQEMKSAINRHVAAIVLVGTPPEAQGVSAANAAHIPVIGVQDGTPDPSLPGQGSGEGYFGSASGDYELDGELMADTAIVEAKGQPVKAVIETFGGFAVAAATVDGVKKVFSSCSSCSIVSTHNIQPADWATKIKPVTASAIRATPGVNWVFTAVDNMGTLAASGVESAGLTGKVFVASGDGSGSGPLSQVKSGQIYRADPGFSEPWVGWLAMYQVVRAINGEQPGAPAVPTRYFNSENLQQFSSKDLDTPTTLYGDAYVAGFKALFGVQ